MRKVCEAMTYRNGYAAHFKGYYDENDPLLPFVLYLETYTSNTEHGWLDKHRNKVDRYCNYTALLRDIANRI